MRDFAYVRVGDAATAVVALAQRPDARLVAGGTDLLNLLKDDIESPALLVDINQLDLVDIHVGPDGLNIGALARMSDVAAHPGVRANYPVIAQTLEQSASPQVRNMATMGGNLVQRTRCPYFRAETPLPCNKRRPGSGCAAAEGDDRSSAIFGWSQHCVATHPSDLAVVLAALDATVRVRSLRDERTMAVTDFYRLPDQHPERDTELSALELITAIEVPPLPAAARSVYVKVRDRASYEFALVSCAVAVHVYRERVQSARIALGGVAAKPWRLTSAEQALVGVSLSADRLLAALDLSFAEAEPLRHNAFKVDLAKRAVVRALMKAGEAA
ncbi:MAG: FAD binding domain-containing protein [Pseudonocardiaceae bacterium]